MQILLDPPVKFVSNVGGGAKAIKLIRPSTSCGHHMFTTILAVLEIDLFTMGDPF